MSEDHKQGEATVKGANDNPSAEGPAHDQPEVSKTVSNPPQPEDIPLASSSPESNAKVPDEPPVEAAPAADLPKEGKLRLIWAEAQGAPEDVMEHIADYMAEDIKKDLKEDNQPQDSSNLASQQAAPKGTADSPAPTQPPGEAPKADQ